MLPDLLIGGLQFPGVLALLIGCAVTQWLLDRVFVRLGIYAWVWHPGLFRVAILLALCVLAGRCFLA